MYPRWLLTISFLLITCFCAQTSYGQNFQAEKRKLTNLEQQLSLLQTQQAQLQTQLSQNQAELDPLLHTHSPEKDILNQAFAARAKAKMFVKENPSPANKAKLQNLEFKYALAERKYNKANAQKIQLQEQNNTLSQTISNNSTQITSLSQRIEKQKIIVTQARLKSNAAKQAQKAKEEQLKVAAAQAEISRLKAQLEQQKIASQKKLQNERAAAARKEATLQAAAEKAVALATSKHKDTAGTSTTNATILAIPPATTIKTTSTPSTKAPAVATPPAPSQTSKLSAKKTSRVNDNDLGIYFLTTAEQIEAEEQLLSEIKVTPRSKKGSRRKYVILKTLQDSGDKNATKLHLDANSIFRGKTTLGKSDTQFSILSHRWNHSVPASSKDVQYTVIFDNSNPNHPRLICYNSALSN